MVTAASNRLTILLATGNPAKLREVRQILAPLGIGVMSLAEHEVLRGAPVEETGRTFAANALIKARWAGGRAGCVAVADDSGLVVDALGGAPGIYSARYAGDEASDADNNRKLLGALAGVPTAARTARFECAAVVFVPEGVEAGPLRGWVEAARPGALDDAGDGEPIALGDGVAVAFRGTLEGIIIDPSSSHPVSGGPPRGLGGFGYDPLFLLPERGLTTAELRAEEKNALSHRGQAFGRLAKAIRGLTASAKG